MGLLPPEWLNHSHLSMMSSALVFFMTLIDGGFAVVASVAWSNLSYFLLRKFKIAEESKFIIALIFGFVMGILSSIAFILSTEMYPKSTSDILANFGSLLFVTPLTLAIFYFSHITKNKSLSGLIYGLMAAGAISMFAAPFVQVGLFTLSSAIFSWLFMILLTAINEGEKHESFHIISVIFGLILGGGIQMVIILGQGESYLSSLSIPMFAIVILIAMLNVLGFSPAGFDTIFKLK